MKQLIEMLAKVGFHGAIGLTVIGAVVFVAVYGVMHQPDHELTSRAVDALVLGVGSLITAAVFMLRGGNEPQ